MKQLLREIIKEWQEQEFPEIKPREIDLKEFYFPKIKKAVCVTGFRRCGKTFLLLELAKKIGKENCIYLNFEDERIPLKTEVLTNFSEIIKELKGHKKIVLLLDEIQNIPLWSKWTRRMLDTQDYFIFLSGSSSKLSSKEIPTELRGRAITLELFPLSFKEFLIFKNEIVEKCTQSKILNLLREYLEFGGFPEVVLADPGKKYLLIEEYYKTFLIRDIFERYNIRQKVILKELVRLLLNSTYFSISKLANILKSAGYKIGKGTVANYLEYLKTSLFLWPLEIFSPKIKNRLQCPRKSYFVDNFFLSRFSSKFSKNFGRLMENLAARELFRKCALNPLLEVYYWKDYHQREVDFVLKENLKVKQLIQVTYASSKQDIEEREIQSLIKGAKELKVNDLLMITWDLETEQKINGKKVKFVPLWKWLLQ